MRTTWKPLSNETKRDNSTESPRLVLLLNGCQVVRMMELLRTFGIFAVYRRAGGLVGLFKLPNVKQ